MGYVLLGVRDQGVPIELLRCSKVAAKVMSESSSANARMALLEVGKYYILLLGIREEPSVHVLDRNLCSERRVRRNGGKVYWVGKLRRRHVVFRDNVTHRDRVAGTVPKLLSVRDGLSNAEIDAGE